MAGQISIFDEVRLNILDALSSAKAVQPNISKLQKHTGYHKATIKASLNFFKKEGVLRGFGPKIDFRAFGYGLEVVELLQVDLSKKELWNIFLEKVKKDPHIHYLTALIGSGNWNIMTRHFYKDVESYHRETMKNYYSLPGIYDLIKDRAVYYATTPVYKNTSRTESIIKALRQDYGLE